MDVDQFWTLVERVHTAAPTDMGEKCRLLAVELRQLPTEEISSFAQHFGDCLYRAYDYDVWAAAYIINGGCSDDSFSDFRSTLISMGRAPFEAAMLNADSLADLDIDPTWATYEGYQYVPGEIFDELGGKPAGLTVRLHPKEPTGVRFNEWELSPRFPKLVAKYKYNEAAALPEKQRLDKRAHDHLMADRLATILLDSGMIPACGLIPQPRIVAQVLKTRRAPESTRRDFTWEPWPFDEVQFWLALGSLQKFKPWQMPSRPDLHEVKLTLDVGAPEANSHEEWKATLKKRGLL